MSQTTPKYLPKYNGTREFYLVYSELIQAARYKGRVTYQDIATIMGLPLSGNYMSKEVGQMLGDISENELAYGRPMLSAIAVNVKGLPGSGFFTLARDMKQLGLDEPSAETRFWEETVTKVYQTWQRQYKPK